jgi:hypothetical protein
MCARFSNAVEGLGVEVTGMEGLPCGKRGMKVCHASGRYEYEVVVDVDGKVLLGRNRMGNERVRLGEGPISEQTFAGFVEAVRASEKGGTRPRI